MTQKESEVLTIVYFADGVQKKTQVDMQDLFTDGKLDKEKALWFAMRNEEAGTEIMNPKIINNLGHIL